MKGTKRLLALVLAILTVFTTTATFSIPVSAESSTEAALTTVINTNSKFQINTQVWGTGGCWRCINALSKEVFGVAIPSGTNGGYYLTEGNNNANWTTVGQCAPITTNTAIWNLLSQSLPGDVLQYRNSTTWYENKETGERSISQHTAIIHHNNGSTITIYDYVNNHAREYTVTQSTLTSVMGTWANYSAYGMTIYRCKKSDSVYLNQCNFYPADCSIQVSSAGSVVKSLPCSKSTDSNSVDIETASGKKYAAMGFYRNSAGNFWFKVKTSSGAIGYVYSGDVSTCTYNTTSAITSPAIPKTIVQGNTFSTGGTISTNNRIISITASVTSTDKTKTYFSKTVDFDSSTHLHSYDLSNAEINNAMTFKQLISGSYKYLVTVKFGYFKIPSSGNPKETTFTLDIINSNFTVSSSGTDTTDENVKQYQSTANTGDKGLYYVSSTTPLRDIPAESGNIVRSLSKGTVVEIESSGKNLANHVWYKTKDGLYLWPYVDSTLRLHKITAPFYFEYATANKTNASLYICNSINLNPYVTSATCKNLTHIGIIIYTKSGSTYKQVASAYETLTSTSTTQAKAWYNVSPTLESGNTVLKDSSGNRYVFTPGNTYYYKMYVEYDYNNTCLKTDSQNFADDSGYFSFIAPAGSACVHNVTELRNVVAATCTTAGYSGDKYCLSCGIKVSNGSTIAPLEHDLSTVSVDATCTTNGYVEYSCLRCEYSSRTVIPATGHVHIEVRNAKAATCSATGYTGDTYCTDCGTKLSSGTTIAKTAHTVVTDKAVAATCTTAGKTAGSHCSVCGTVITAQTVIPATGHQHTEVRNVKAATCTATGYTGDTYCTDCGTKISSGSTIAKTAHTVVTDKAVAATCTTAGKTAGSHCSVCGTVITAQTVIPATGHQHTEVRNAKAATCTATGYTGDTYCTDCGTKISSGSTIAKKAHTVVTDKAVAATCTTAGKTAGSHCSVCGTVITAQTVIPATGHQHTEVRNAKAATETAEGYTGDTCCKDCGTILSRGSAIPKLTPSSSVVITVPDVKAVKGAEVTMDLTISQNSGISVLVLTLKANSALTFLGATNGNVFTTLDYDTNLLFLGGESSDTDKKLVTLRFRISATAADGDYSVALTFREAYDEDDNSVNISVTPGKVTVSSILYGDANGDGKVDAKDLSLMRKYMAAYDYDTGTAPIAVEAGADANGDGKIDSKDLSLLRKYMASYDYTTGTSTVVLGPNH